MFAPKLYTTYKFKFRLLQGAGFKLELNKQELADYEIKQQDNMLFHHIRRITGLDDECGKFVVFVDCKGCSSDVEGLTQAVTNGFTINGRHFVIGERSASMTRNSILSFTDERISDRLSEAVTMGADTGPTVLSKIMAYRGLNLSSCHCLDGYIPKVIVVPDFEATIPDQHIKYIYDKHTSFTTAEGTEIPWTQKDVTDDVRDLTIKAFDGCGMHHPAITEQVRELLGSRDDPTTILWRGPYIKGVTSEMDYVSFYKERGVESIKDIWGIEHDVTEWGEPMVIMSKSMYKGYDYYNFNHDVRDWLYYWDQFRKYHCCLGVAKWNFDLETEPVYTRCNYQVLQTLSMEKDDFLALADKSVDWAEKITSGDRLSTLCFLGLNADRMNPINDYAKAVLKNPVMLEQESVRSYLVTLLDKYMNDMKCGKLWIKSCFKFQVPDLVAFMEAVAGLPMEGCLAADEFFCFNRSGTLTGEHLITRNPHICESENVVLTAVDRPDVQLYFGRLVNCAVVNVKSITPQRLNGGDFDGDLILIFDDESVLQGVNREAIPVIDVQDKVAVEPEEFNAENKLKVILRTMKNLIGEYSNYATAFHNKSPRTPEQREKYQKYIDIISVLTGKSIDYAKTGVLYPMPRMISKYGRPLPWFMRYASDYYGHQNLSRSPTNMNRLCWALEGWEKRLRWTRRKKNFDWTTMVNPDIPIDQKTFDKVEDIYRRYVADVKELSRKLAGQNLPREELSEAYGQCYESYRSECKLVCPDKRKLANIAVTLAYRDHPSWSRKFIWIMAGPGVVDNIQQVDITLPERDDDGEYEYLGRNYKMVDIPADSEELKEVFK